MKELKLELGKQVTQPIFSQKNDSAILEFGCTGITFFELKLNFVFVYIGPNFAGFH